MVKYIVLTPKTANITNIKASTIYGALIWMSSLYYGEEIANELATRMAQNPIFLISDLLPKYFLPKPLLPKDMLNQEINQTNDINLSIKVKKLKKIKFIHYKSIINSFTKKESENTLNLNKFLSHAPNLKFSKQTIIHNTINRLTNRVYKEEGSLSTIWQLEANQYLNDYWLILKILDNYAFEKFKIATLIKRLFEVNGLGFKSNIGYNTYEANWLNPKEQDDIKTLTEYIASNPTSHIMLLSNSIPKPEDPTQGAYKIETKRGKYSRYAQINNPQRILKPLTRWLKAGSIFKVSLDNNFEYFGTTLRITKNQPTFEYAYSLTLNF